MCFDTSTHIQQYPLKLENKRNKNQNNQQLYTPKYF